MKIGKFLIKIGKKICGENKKNSNAKNLKLGGDRKGGCFFIWGKPRTPKMFK
ncbi:hypothetical protein KYB31_09065 [Clostridium felsineum]|uniref:hypothetical protein n=1 Tax=Clostridium felsineum TaxID=36839 RepID=UPI00214D8C6E|nr:hypothetical protein [Clostridium felsineum]MCR3759138.1 hypothetical protein [Clostridium felsineum]